MKIRNMKLCFVILTLVFSFSFLVFNEVNCFAQDKHDTTLEPLVDGINIIGDSENGFYLYNPDLDDYYPIVDSKKKAKEISDLNPTTEEEKQAFINSKINTMKKSNAAELDNFTNFLEGSSNDSADKKDKKDKNGAPVPGGVGYGAFYTSTFRTDFVTGTRISMDIIAPTTPGGNVNTWLYLTATNRAQKGVEAFILYNGQNNMTFKVFDWARPSNEHWQTSIPFSDLSDYLTTKNIDGVNYQVVSVHHLSETFNGSDWHNVVWLFNYSASAYETIYSYSYPSSTSEQQSGWVGTWGPIVETFQNNYNNVNTLGFRATYLVSKNSNYQWGSWKLLTSFRSTIRNDNLGFNVLFLYPNHTFAVN